MNETRTLVIRGDRVVLPDGIRPAALHVRAGRIAAITSRDEGAVRDDGSPDAVSEIDAGPLVVSPGLVDSHVHINDPGREDWEGFEHATRAAAAGGVTTLVDMPLNSIPATTTMAGLEAKRRAAEKRCHVDVGFWGGVVPGNSGELEPLARGGVLGFKCFLCPSGVDEFAHVTERDLREAFPVLARLGLPLLAHAELPSSLREPHGDPRRHATWLESRPPAAEHSAIELLIRLAGEFHVHVHVVHLASAEAVPSLVAARARGVPITVETCPHYLTFAADEVPDGATAFKCAPPIRGRRHRDGLWTALADGVIDLITTDHSPAPPALKHLDDGDFVQAWGGIASLQVGLPIVWTGARARGLALDRVPEWMSAAPARLAGLDRLKGRIAIGCDADLVIWDPDGEVQIDGAALEHRHRVTPYDHMRVFGQVHKTILRGEVIFENGTGAGYACGRAIGKLREGA